jgi:hypothetical protein
LSYCDNLTTLCWRDASMITSITQLNSNGGLQRSLSHPAVVAECISVQMAK